MTRAESQMIALEHVYWWVRQGYGPYQAAEALGIWAPPIDLDWPYVAKWIMDWYLPR